MENPGSANKYFAFISYSSKDEGIVKWLHRHLENYRIPTSLASDASAGGRKLPKYLRPVFWYKQDLSGTVLSESLRTNLSDSRFLIVVCSPAAAASQWVNDEVATFIAQGKEAQIIPLIVDGTPNSGDPATECFPEALRQLGRERELRGINLAAQGRRRALVDIIATMLGVRFDALWQRHKRRERTRRIMAAGVCLLIAAIAYGIYEYKRTRTEYYLDYADSYGIPQGISRIDEGQVADAGTAFRFSYSRTPFGEEGALKWRLDKVDYVNSSGTVTELTPDAYPLFYPSVELRYQEGKLAEITNKDRTGRTVLRYSVKDDLEGNPAAIYDITGGEIEQSAGYLNASTSIADRSDDPNRKDVRSKIKRIHFVRDAAGRISRFTYHTNNDDDLSASVTADNNGFYGQSQVRDSLGRITAITYLDERGEPTEDFRGVATTKYSYGKPRTVEFFDVKGRPVNGNLGASKIVSTCNEFGRPDEYRYLDAEGKPALSNEFLHRAVFAYDSRGFETSRACFGLGGEPVDVKGGWHKIQEERDSRGRLVREAYFDSSGKPALRDNLYASSTISYTSDGLPSEVRYFDTEGRPAYNNENGDYGQRYSYDTDGYLRRLEFLGADGKPAASPASNYAAIEYTRDKYHRVRELRYVDTEGAGVRCQNGHAGVRRSYDSRGNETEVVYTDTEGRPTLTKWNVAILRRKYDARGNVTGVYYFGPVGNPIFNRGRFGEEAEYTASGQQAVKRFVDGEGRLMRGPDWWAYRKRSFDEKGHIVSEEFFGPDSLPAIDRQTVAAKTVYICDNDGNRTETLFYGTDGCPANCRDGYHRLLANFDANGRVVARRYFTPDGRKGLYQGLFHRDTLAYDSRGNLTMVAIFAPDGSPASTKYDIHRKEFEYDPRGLKTEERRFGIDGKLSKTQGNWSYSVHRIKYNALGQDVESSYYNEKGAPHLYKTDTKDPGAFRARVTFNELGLVERTDYYLPEDTVNPDYSILSKFNAMRQPVEMTVVDSQGKPREYNSGESKMLISYDLHNREKSRKLFKPDGSLLMWTVNEYDDLNRLIASHHLSADSTLTVSQIVGMTERFATLRKKYDAFGNETEYAYFGPDGKPMDAGNGYASIRYKYDDRFRRTSIATFDTKGHPCNVGTRGWHEEKTSYNDRNLPVAIEYFGRDGKPANEVRGTEEISKINYSYDEYGRQTSADFFRWNGGRYVKNEGGNPLGEVAAGGKSTASQLLGVVEFAGSFKDAGYEGSLYILRFDTWTIHDSLDSFGKVLAATAQKPRRIVFIPLIIEDGKVTPGEIVDRVFPPGPLGLRLMDTTYDGISDFLEAAFKTIKN